MNRREMLLASIAAPIPLVSVGAATAGDVPNPQDDRITRLLGEHVAYLAKEATGVVCVKSSNSCRLDFVFQSWPISSRIYRPFIYVADLDDAELVAAAMVPRFKWATHVWLPRQTLTMILRSISVATSGEELI